MLDSDYAGRLAQQYGERPPWAFPSIYSIATSADREAQRIWLNQALCAIPETDRDRLLGRLEKEANFLSTYNELATAAIFLQAGYSFRYEAELGGRTPDLLIPSGEDHPMLLVEVVTKFRNDSLRRIERQWKELATRVEMISVPLVLLVRGLGRGRPEPPDSGTAKRVVSELQKTLLATPVGIGDEIEIEDYVFVIAGQVPGARASLATPAGASTYNADLVLEAVREKVSRYCSGADRVGAALIVVLAAESQSPLSIDLLRTALTGAQTVTMSFDIFEPGPVSSGPFSMRAENIPPAFHPSVSAIAWLEPGIENPGTLTLFPIASAERQLRFRQSERLVIEQIAKN
ncbi:hypothetical protein [Ferrimicrobium sp.]|uniref:hypothetical protein n=1 Tax=Ferrimicrobium sp. TaxID=2926050 RepID=UPI00260439D2|nr:hypothetical protein [Ferrimicrobium sp.]